MFNKKIKSKDAIAFTLAYKKYKNDYNELADSMFQYMNSHVNNILFDKELFRDEIENLIGIRKHKEIINYIIKNFK
jgi:hypothetical protein